jgi:hypothetical protein
MPISFPSTPATGDTYSYNGITWVWTGTAWARRGGLEFGDEAGRPIVNKPSLYFNTDIEALQLYYPGQDNWDRVSTFTYQQDPTDTTGQTAYTNPGTYSWICPAGVFQVHVVCVGGGAGGDYAFSGTAGGGGGGLAWLNNISVTPGESYLVQVGSGGAIGTNGGNSFFISTSTVCGFGGQIRSGNAGGAGGNFFTTIGPGGGGFGGAGGDLSFSGYSAGGGGAGGYSGNGGKGGNSFSASFSGTGGAAGGGGGSNSTNPRTGGSGGGVGILGEGASGAGQTWDSFSGTGIRGGGGSGGTGLGTNVPGGIYGGGGGGSHNSASILLGGGGAVRIIWGPNRAFPSTNTGDL